MTGVRGINSPSRQLLSRTNVSLRIKDVVLMSLHESMRGPEPCPEPNSVLCQRNTSFPQENKEQGHSVSSSRWENPSLFLHSVLKTVSIKYPSGRRAACIAVFFGTASEYQKSRRGFQQERSPWKGTLCHKQDSHPRLRVTLMHIDIYHTIYMHIYIYMHIMCIYMCIPFKRDFANINFTFSWICLHFHGFFPPLF